MSETHVLGSHSLRNRKRALQSEVDHFIEWSRLSSGQERLALADHAKVLAERCEVLHANRALRQMENCLVRLSGPHVNELDRRAYWNYRGASTRYERVMIMLGEVIWAGKAGAVSYQF